MNCKIIHFYPHLMNLYGSYANLTVLRRYLELLGHSVDVLHIVGGGSNNNLLNQMTANAIKRPVIAGPSEGTVIGNLLVQAMALGEIKDLPQLREVVANSFENKVFLPEGDTSAWDEAYERLLALN